VILAIQLLAFQLAKVFTGVNSENIRGRKYH